MTAEEQKKEEQPATIATVRAAQWSANFTTLVSTGAQFFLLCAVVFGAGWVVIDRSFAAGKDGAQVIVAPLVPRVTFLEVQVPFVVSEVREIRVEQRALAEKGHTAPELARPMAPLPTPPDGGR